MKTGDIVNVSEAINNLLEMDLPPKVSIDLAILSEEIKPILNVFNTKREEIVTKYASTNDKGERFIPPDKIELFNSAINEIVSVDIENKYHKLDMKDIINIPSVKGKLIYSLYPFIGKEVANEKVD